MGQSFLVLSIQALLIGTSLENTNNFCGHFPSGDFTRACNFLNRWDDATKHLPGQIYKCTPSQGNTIYDCMDLACLCRFLNGTFTSKCLLPNGEELKKAVRKEYRSLTDEERERYHKAVRTIKQNGEYDKLSMIHTRSTTSPAAHGGPGFLGWHREFIKRYEIALRRVDHKVALPYWDSTIEERLHHKQDSTLWSKELMGEADSDGYVRQSPFGRWYTTDGMEYFTRYIGQNRGYLISETDFQTIVQNTPSYQHIFAYTAASQQCYNPGFWTALEYVHGLPHMFVGGHMARITASTNDPLFWMHHAFVDLIWENWRQEHQKRVTSAHL
ncbi:hypothetical protein Y032_0002g928 [Ancylostoma ceylanicum]|uniref:Tyrosinase copper-binding domain-containing protein n=1 Tax=Ancylostoma ceylanicum TaxID=53326 RepID=A0A016W3W4_9BILA|nr:hypothetical protein Y032_0002g928 [Ancylostoma ceylanicum]